MTAFEVGAAIVAISLAIGIAVGALIVIALPQIRYYCNARRNLYPNRWEELPPSGDASEDDERSP